jgi:FkbM family methyltransferase
VSLRDIGIRFSKLLPFIKPFAKATYNALPAWLHDTPTSRAHAFFRSTPNVTFVQVGAFDGKTGDPIRDLVIKNAQWTGILIEPQPVAFKRLQRNYEQQRERLIFLNCALSTSPHDQVLFSIAESQFKAGDLPEWAREISSLDPRHIPKYFPDARVEEILVKTMTFDEVMIFASIGKVDLIVMDVEGYERKLIETIKLAEYQVRFLIYEHVHVSPDDQRQLKALLRQNGFRVKEFGRDTVAYKP